MAQVLLFHHALGLTAGVHAFADSLRAAGHEVHVPDLLEGRTFAGVDEGVAHAESIGFDTIIDRGARAADELPTGLVYMGMSLGVMAAQKLAQTRPGTKGAVLLHAAVPTEYFGPWPDGLPLQIHTMVDDGWGDADVARQLDAEIPHAEVHLYPGDRHLFTDSSTPDHDPAAAAQVLERVLGFLAATDDA